jgi:hypothetical protein
MPGRGGVSDDGGGNGNRTIKGASPMNTTRPPVVFIHGLWLHASSWDPWVELFAKEGYAPVAPGWPGVPETVKLARAYPDRIADHGIEESHHPLRRPHRQVVGPASHHRALVRRHDRRETACPGWPSRVCDDNAGTMATSFVITPDNTKPARLAALVDAALLH